MIENKREKKKREKKKGTNQREFIEKKKENGKIKIEARTTSLH